MNKSVKTLLAVTLALVWAGSVNASVDWKFGSNGGSYNSNPSDTNFHKLVDGIDLKITGWASSGTSATSNFQLENLTQYGGGLGIVSNSNGTPEHAIGDFFAEEFLLLEFSEAVAITGIGNGYDYECQMSNDSCNSSSPRHGSNGWNTNGVDASVLAFTGGLTGGIGGDGFQRSDMTQHDSSSATQGLTQKGWSHFGTTFSGGSATINTPANPDNQVFSNFWLIGNANEHITSAGGWEDFFKLNLVSVERRTGCQPRDPGCEPGVPAPATAALLGLGLLLLRRRVSQ